eukprot:scaffold17741_cov132-Isochrysis_galbana.AAC.1
MTTFDLADSTPIRRTPNTISFKAFANAHTIKLTSNRVVFDAKEPKFKGKWPLTVQLTDAWSNAVKAPYINPNSDYESQIIDIVLHNREVFAMDELSDADIHSQYKPLTTTYKDKKQLMFKVDPQSLKLANELSPEEPAPLTGVKRGDKLYGELTAKGIWVSETAFG